MKNIKFTAGLQTLINIIGLLIMLVGLYFSFVDDSVLNNGILGAGILLATSQTKN
jgi:hypothetical protein